MEQSEFVQLVTENIKSIYTYSLARTSCREDAEDLAGDIIAEILKSQANIRNADAFYGYIWKIASNTYKKFIRYRVRHPVYLGKDDDISCTYFVTMEDDSETPEEAVIKKESLSLLRRELALLSEEHRKCTIAYYFEDKPCAQVADELGISTEMVKYYLFKTRKILKEGIGMQYREFGEKSYNPAYFNFDPIFGAMFNSEYYRMFSRKIPGNIMLSAYYSPVSVSDLSMELGIPTPYVEDELELLMKYNLITKTDGGKYQTNILIITKEFEKELVSALEKKLTIPMSNLYEVMKSKIHELRKFDFHGNDFSDNRLLWMITILSLLPTTKKAATAREWGELFPGCPGYVMGYDHNSGEESYSVSGFAGYSGIDNGSYCSLINHKCMNSTQEDTSILGNAVHRKKYTQIDIQKKLVENGSATVINEFLSPEFPVIFESDKEKFAYILSDINTEIDSINEKASEIAAEIMKIHAPKGLAENKKLIDDLVYWYIHFFMISMIPYLLVKYEYLKPAENNEKIGIVAFVKD